MILISVAWTNICSLVPYTSGLCIHPLFFYTSRLNLDWYRKTISLLTSTVSEDQRGAQSSSNEGLFSFTEQKGHTASRVS